MASLYSTLFVCVCITLLLHPHIAKYYATTAYASRENSKETDFITPGLGHTNPFIWPRKEAYSGLALDRKMWVWLAAGLDGPPLKSKNTGPRSTRSPEALITLASAAK